VCQSRKALRRSISLDYAGHVTIRVGRSQDSYDLFEFVAPGREDETPGRGFRCVKFGGETFHVFLSATNQDDSCTCTRFKRTQACEHRDGLKALLTRGLLDDTPALNA
jgi:hypothetical protein